MLVFAAMAVLSHTLSPRGLHRRGAAVAIASVTLVLVASLLASVDATARPADPEPATEAAAPFSLND